MTAIRKFRASGFRVSVPANFGVKSATSVIERLAKFKGDLPAMAAVDCLPEWLTLATAWQSQRR